MDRKRVCIVGAGISATMAKHIPTLLLLLLAVAATAESKTAAPKVVAPGPTPAPLNLTAVLEKGGQYTDFMRLLKSTQVGEQIASQLNNSFNGLTVVAPTDNAFGGLKPGTLNSLSQQQQVALVLYHVLPRFYSLTSFETTSNPVSTQASGSGGVYTVNVTSTSSQVNISTGVDQAQISNSLYSEFPLAVYSVEKVLLPYDIFGPKPPAAAPVPAVDGPKDKPAGKAAPKAKAPGGAEAESSTSAAAVLRLGWGVGAGIVLGFVGYVV